MKQINGKDLICNGSINPSLTIDELLQFDIDQKRTALHYLQVEGGYPPKFEEIETSVFEKLPELYSYKQWQEFDENQINEALTIVYNRLQQHTQYLITKTGSVHYELGKSIHSAQQELRFGGELEMTIDKLRGYISCVGNWNGFKAGEVCRGLNRLHKIAPRRDCGINNCNTGSIRHKWSIESAFIFLKFGLCYEQEVNDIQTWFKTLSGIKEILKADSFRLQIDPVEKSDNQAYITLVMWWD
jgi:hypothetical protein